MVWRVELAVAAAGAIIGTGLMAWLATVANTTGDLPRGLVANFVISTVASMLVALGAYLDRRRSSGLLVVWAATGFLFVYGVALFWLWVLPTAVLGLTAGVMGMVNHRRYSYGWE